MKQVWEGAQKLVKTYLNLTKQQKALFKKNKAKDKKAIDNIDAGSEKKNEEVSEKNKDKEAAFLFYLGQLRYRYYLAAKPKIKSSDKETYNALSDKINGK